MTWWRQESKESAAARARTAMIVDQPQYDSRWVGDRRQHSEETMKAVVAAACCKMIAQHFGALQFITTRNGEPVDTPEELAALMRRPNLAQSGAQFRELWALFFAIHGEAWTERVLVDGGRPKELHLFKPEEMAPIPGSAGVPKAYEYTASNGQKQRWEVDQITGESDMLFTRAPNPVDEWRGLSPIPAAGDLINAQQDVGKWNASLLQNAGKPSGLLIFEEELTNEQRERAKQSWDDSYSGSVNAGKTIKIDGSKATYTQTGLSPTDMDWIDGNRETARQIALTYGVPPMMLGIPGDNTYSNMREARLGFYDDRIIPLGMLFADEMTRFLAVKFGDRLVFDINRDKIEALSLRREQRWQRVNSADSLSVDEKRIELGFPPLGPAKGGDIVPAVQQYAGLSFDIDDDPEEAGARAFGSGDG